MTTGLDASTFINLQLNAGVFLKNFEYSSATNKTTFAELLKTAQKDSTHRLGATRGGGTFECAPEVRNIEADGKRYEFIGSTVFDSWTVRLTGTLMEITPENLSTLIAAADVTGEPESGKRTIKARTDLLPKDYIKSLVWIGDTSNSGYVLIALKNALNTTGATMTFSDKNEGTLPFEFHAHQDSVEDSEYAPFEVVFLKDLPD